MINVEGKPTQRLHLCTNCFDKEELEDIILPQMKDFDAKLYGGSKVNNKGYMVTIYKKNNIKKFLEYIGDCPFDDYRHKWDFRDSLVPNFGQFRDEWIRLINNGVSKEQIMEDYQCSDSTFYRILHNKHKHNGEYVIETEN